MDLATSAFFKLVPRSILISFWSTSHHVFRLSSGISILFWESSLFMLGVSFFWMARTRLWMVFSMSSSTVRVGDDLLIPDIFKVMTVLVL